MKVFFDANVILDWLLKREPTFAKSYEALRETIKQEHMGLISAAAINDIHYVIKKALKSEKEAREKIEAIVSLFNIAKVDSEIIIEAIRLHGKDFEDDIVCATAIESGAECIITNNKKDYVGYLPIIAVYTPEEYLQKLNE